MTKKYTVFICLVCRAEATDEYPKCPRGHKDQIQDGCYIVDEDYYEAEDEEVLTKK